MHKIIKKGCQIHAIFKMGHQAHKLFKRPDEFCALSNGPRVNTLTENEMDNPLQFYNLEN